MVEIRKAETDIGVKNVKASKTAEEVGPDKYKCDTVLIFNPFLEEMKEEARNCTIHDLNQNLQADISCWKNL